LLFTIYDIITIVLHDADTADDDTYWCLWWYLVVPP